jgi:predicted acylesterase/phospholipase RssA
MSNAAEPRIGEDGQPVRAVVFSGGLLDTVMQLGVVHALLVSRAVPPDIAVGVSAGAVNAVALAEVLEAGKQLEVARRRQMSKDTGGPEPPEDLGARLNSRIARFRQILDNYRRAPGEIIDALLPDPFQVEAQRPLQPLQLPIQQNIERRGRLDALRSRAGMINLYNKLLDMRLSIGSLTRAVRVFLGFMEAGETRDTRRRVVQAANQCLEAWLVLGSNLYRLAPLVPSLVAAFFGRRARVRTYGYTAAEIMFQSVVIQPLLNVAGSVLSLVLLALAWVVLSAVLLLLPAFVAQLVALLPVAGLSVHKGLLTGIVYALVAMGIVVLARPQSLRGAERAVSYALTFLLLLIRWIWALALVIAAILLLHWAIRRGSWNQMLAIWKGLPGWWIWGYGFLLVLGLLAWLWSRRTPPAATRPFWSRLLEQYDLHDSLFNEYPLQQLFVRLFDPHYYGGAGIQDAVEQALRDNNEAGEGRFEGKAVGSYSKPRVGLTVAEVSSGDLQFLDPSTRVVNGLLAATARVPFFPAQEIKGGTYVDGTNVANEPTRALLDYLRDRLNPEARVVHVYTVAPLPVTQGGLGGKPAAHGTQLVDVIRRALQLQRYRDATLERRLTELYSKTIPGEKVLYPYIPPGSTQQPPKQFIRAWVHAIEPDTPLGVTQRILDAESNERRRDIIDQTVADGCRAALEVMMQPAIGAVCDAQKDCDPGRGADPPLKTLERPVVRCRAAVQKHLNVDDPDLPGSNSELFGPGLAEICSRCWIATQHPQTGESKRELVSLRVPKPDFHLPPWPSVMHRDPEAEAKAEKEFDSKKRVAPKTETNVPQRAPWPISWRPGLPTRRPLVNLLFSGGVFRGVYQIGVLNALSEVGIRPDVVAGASVGTITAAMAARALVVTDLEERQLQIARLAATYLALDRLILTDRFADFIRNFTLRAGATRLSLRQADRVFRRYDRPARGTFEQELRLVVAGLERLFYLSPFELKALVEAIRDRRTNEIYRLLRQHLQEWLSRSGIESEILGAEPLALLIREHVIDAISAQAGYSVLDASHVPFDVFLTTEGLCLLATATNLSQGQLEILGDRQLEVGKHPDLTLLNGLLASSAFPGVFRPREAWELQRGTRSQDQYIDGGVIDNLPLDAVAEFLHRAACNSWIDRRPQQGPHLLFSASLQTALPRLTDDQISGLRDNWPTLLGRTKQLGYNQKLDVYSLTQRDIRTIYNTASQVSGKECWTPLNLEVVTVRPNWLCGTFAFHPMLGFRRAKQAASIAHGCATTLTRLATLRGDLETEQWAEAWGINLHTLPIKGTSLVPQDHGPGKCWFRAGIDCPFSPQYLAKLKGRAVNKGGLPEDELKQRTAIELKAIYHACGEAATHQGQ